jgi:hypothetical protein
MMRKNSVIPAEAFNIATYFRDYAGRLMPKDQGRAFLEIPFHQVRAADSACFHFHQNFTRANFWLGDFFNPHVV